MSDLLTAQQLLNRLPLEDLEILRAYLRYRHRPRSVPTSLPSRSGNGLVRLADLIDMATGDLQTILELMRHEQLAEDEEVILRQTVDLLYNALQPTPRELSHDSPYYLLRGTFEYKWVNGYGPYAYLRYYAIRGGRNHDQRRKKSVYLGRAVGLWLFLLDSGIEEDYLSQPVKQAIHSAMKYAYWHKDIIFWHVIYDAVVTLARMANWVIVAHTLEQAIAPPLRTMEEEELSPQQQARATLATLRELADDPDFREHYLAEARYRYQYDTVGFDPMLAAPSPDTDAPGLSADHESRPIIEFGAWVERERTKLIDRDDTNNG